jgi:hypothetical protein
MVNTRGVMTMVGDVTGFRGMVSLHDASYNPLRASVSKNFVVCAPLLLLVSPQNLGRPFPESPLKDGRPTLAPDTPESRKICLYAARNHFAANNRTFIVSLWRGPFGVSAPPITPGFVHLSRPSCRKILPPENLVLLPGRLAVTS